MNNKSLVHFFVLSALSLMAESASAAQEQDAGVLQRQLQEQVEKSRPEEKMPQAEQSAEKVEVDPAAQKVEIKGYQFKGNTLLSNDELQTIVESWKNKALTLAELKDVTVAIQEAYAKKSRIAQASVPPQEIQDGLLLVEIVEGKFGTAHAQVVEQDRKLRFPTENAEKFVTQINKSGRYIDAQNIYRSITTLNELPGVRASGSFEAGEAVGVSDIKVSLRSTPLLSGLVAASNYGSASTGEAQAIGNLNINNPFGIADVIRLDAIQSQGSSYVQGSYMLPLAFNSLKFGVQASYLTYKTLSDWSPKPSEGDATTFGFNATYALTRKPGKHLSLRVAYEDRAYSNESAGVKISEYDVNALTLGLNAYLVDSATSSINLGVNAVFGDLDITNADQLATDVRTTKTQGSFEKITFNISRTQELSILENTNWLVSAYGQLASKNLNSSEQFYLGGPYGVRAYPVSQGGGSQGAVVSTELQRFIADDWLATVFIDVGVVEQYKDVFLGWAGQSNASNVYTLAATGLTLKYTYKNFTLLGTGAYRIGDNPLHTFTGQQLNADNDYKDVQFWIRGSLDF